VFTNKKREGIDTFAYAVSLASMSLKPLKPQSRTRISPLPKTPFDIVAYGFFFWDNLSRNSCISTVCLTGSGTISIHAERLQISDLPRKQNESI